MPEMESDLLSFKLIQSEDSPDALQVDELYSQLESLFGDIRLNKKCEVLDKLEELDTAVNEDLQVKIQPQLKQQQEEFLLFAGSDQSDVLQQAMDNLDMDLEQITYKEVFGE